VSSRASSPPSPSALAPEAAIPLTHKKASERRVVSRFPLKVEVTYQSEHNFYTGITNNLSSGGIFIATHQPARIGDRIEVTFTLPGLDQVCTASGEVRWVREYNPDQVDAPPGLGLRFGELEPAVRLCIERFVQHREPLFFDDDL
jgi:uncharacterized protein (TIGR02266 family)